MSILHIDNAKVDRSTRSVSVNGQTRRLSPKSMSVLDALLAAEGDVVSRAALLEKVWSDVCVGEEVLTQAIAELRRAFNDTPKNARIIGTVPKAGYRLLPTQYAPETPYETLLPTAGINTDAVIEFDVFLLCWLHSV